MPYLTLDFDQIRLAWDKAGDTELLVSRPVLAVEEQLDYGRRAVAVHVPQMWPHGVFCHNCGHRYPCRIVLWGMALLRARGWHLADVVDLIESIQAGDRP